MRRLIGAGFAVLLLSCGGGEDGLIASSQPPAASEQAQLDRDTIVAQREVWRSARPAAYGFEIETRCGCSLAGTYGVTVVGEEVIGVESRDPQAERFRVYWTPTPDDLFGVLDGSTVLQAGEIIPGRATAAFDPTYGYPTAITLEGTDGRPSFEAAIANFVPLEPAVVGDRLPVLWLTISNQSFEDPDVSMTVSVDGEVVVERSFEVEGQHNHVSYRIPLSAGDHAIVLRAETGAVAERVVSIGADRYLYAGYSGCDPMDSETFSIRESDQPFGFG